MREFTTPTIPFKLVDSSIAFDKLFVTFESEYKTLNYVIMPDDVSDGKFKITLKEEETAALGVGVKVEVQINLIRGNARVPSNIDAFYLGKNLLRECVL